MRHKSEWMGEVPCGGCTLCCRRDNVMVRPGDNPGQYQTVPHPYVDGALALAQAPNGDCVYRGSQGCRIHATKPQTCRGMDCRNIAAGMTRTQARNLVSQGVLPMGVWERGVELLQSMQRPESAEAPPTQDLT